uniref:WW domain-containing protein n=1 Tax=Chromera velia CCMP2878 TaxID=1169474 RepID=A0A0G4I1W8_9ALVE|eukprot:Cvel_10245.t1-p1 / transcript=Cvel_10245.t1 / gene=Cvel_10245 / organism=Chromera_velia_CCMP2878 / gene_product=Centrosomal protein of 164 kDa, putative / transcript_product=Centrosomal protein of 164 kDa, putative / location=Cvel_scaffold614:4215-17821(+) / protein_length=2548 / sequence_SO=supercontig / SO=protein_coding / is_pseudo=false
MADTDARLDHLRRMRTEANSKIAERLERKPADSRPTSAVEGPLKQGPSSSSRASPARGAAGGPVSQQVMMEQWKHQQAWIDAYNETEVAVRILAELHDDPENPNVLTSEQKSALHRQYMAGFQHYIQEAMEVYRQQESLGKTVQGFKTEYGSLASRPSPAETQYAVKVTPTDGEEPKPETGETLNTLADALRRQSNASQTGASVRFPSHPPPQSHREQGTGAQPERDGTLHPSGARTARVTNEPGHSYRAEALLAHTTEDERFKDRDQYPPPPSPLQPSIFLQTTDTMFSPLPDSPAHQNRRNTAPGSDAYTTQLASTAAAMFSLLQQQQHQQFLLQKQLQQTQQQMVALTKSQQQTALLLKHPTNSAPPQPLPITALKSTAPPPPGGISLPQPSPDIPRTTRPGGTAGQAPLDAPTGILNLTSATASASNSPPKPSQGKVDLAKSGLGGGLRGAFSKRPRKVPQLSQVMEYAKAIGLNPVIDEEFVWIAEEPFRTPLPEPWQEHVDEFGRIYFFEPETKKSHWDPPAHQAALFGVFAYRTALRDGGFWRVDDQLAEFEQKTRGEMRQWVELYDAKGAVFYTNRETRQRLDRDPRVAVHNDIYLRLKIIQRLKEQLPLLAKAPRPVHIPMTENQLQVRMMRMKQDARQRAPDYFKGAIKLTIRKVKGSSDETDPVLSSEKDVFLEETRSWKRERAARKIQALLRGVHARRLYRGAVVHAVYRTKCATKLQAMVRGYLTRRYIAKHATALRSDLQDRAAVRIQTLFRKKTSEEEVKRRRRRAQWEALLLVQSEAKAHVARAYIQSLAMMRSSTDSRFKKDRSQLLLYNVRSGDYKPRDPISIPDVILLVERADIAKGTALQVCAAERQRHAKQQLAELRESALMLQKNFRRYSVQKSMPIVHLKPFSEENKDILLSTCQGRTYVGGRRVDTDKEVLMQVNRTAVERVQRVIRRFLAWKRVAVMQNDAGWTGYSMFEHLSGAAGMPSELRVAWVRNEAVRNAAFEERFGPMGALYAVMEDMQKEVALCVGNLMRDQKNKEARMDKAAKEELKRMQQEQEKELARQKDTEKDFEENRKKAAALEEERERERKARDAELAALIQAEKEETRKLQEELEAERQKMREKEEKRDKEREKEMEEERERERERLRRKEQELEEEKRRTQERIEEEKKFAKEKEEALERERQKTREMERERQRLAEEARDQEKRAEKARETLREKERLAHWESEREKEKAESAVDDFPKYADRLDERQDRFLLQKETTKGDQTSTSISSPKKKPFLFTYNREGVGAGSNERLRVPPDYREKGLTMPESKKHTKREEKKEPKEKKQTPRADTDNANTSQSTHHRSERRSSNAGGSRPRRASISPTGASPSGRRQSQSINMDVLKSIAEGAKSRESQGRRDSARYSDKADTPRLNSVLSGEERGDSHSNQKMAVPTSSRNRRASFATAFLNDAENALQEDYAQFSSISPPKGRRGSVNPDEAGGMSTGGGRRPSMAPSTSGRRMSVNPGGGTSTGRRTSVSINASLKALAEAPVNADSGGGSPSHAGGNKRPSIRNRDKERDRRKSMQVQADQMTELLLGPASASPTRPRRQSIRPSPVAHEDRKWTPMSAAAADREGAPGQPRETHAAEEHRATPNSHANASRPETGASIRSPTQRNSKRMSKRPIRIDVDALIERTAGGAYPTSPTSQVTAESPSGTSRSKKRNSHWAEGLDRDAIAAAPRSSRPSTASRRSVRLACEGSPSEFFNTNRTVEEAPTNAPPEEGFLGMLASPLLAKPEESPAAESAEQTDRQDGNGEGENVEGGDTEAAAEPAAADGGAEESAPAPEGGGADEGEGARETADHEVGFFGVFGADPEDLAAPSGNDPAGDAPSSSSAEGPGETEGQGEVEEGGGAGPKGEGPNEDKERSGEEGGAADSGSGSDPQKEGEGGREGEGDEGGGGERGGEDAPPEREETPEAAPEAAPESAGVWGLGSPPPAEGGAGGESEEPPPATDPEESGQQREEGTGEKERGVEGEGVESLGFFGAVTGSSGEQGAKGDGAAEGQQREAEAVSPTDKREDLEEEKGRERETGGDGSSPQPSSPSGVLSPSSPSAYDSLSPLSAGRPGESSGFHSRSYAGEVVGGKFVRSAVSHPGQFSTAQVAEIVADLKESEREKAEILRQKREERERRRRESLRRERERERKMLEDAAAEQERENEQRVKRLQEWLKKKNEEAKARRLEEKAAMDLLKAEEHKRNIYLKDVEERARREQERRWTIAVKKQRRLELALEEQAQQTHLQRLGFGHVRAELHEDISGPSPDGPLIDDIERTREEQRTARMATAAAAQRDPPQPARLTGQSPDSRTGPGMPPSEGHAGTQSAPQLPYAAGDEAEIEEHRKGRQIGLQLLPQRQPMKGSFLPSVPSLSSPTNASSSHIKSQPLGRSPKKSARVPEEPESRLHMDEMDPLLANELLANEAPDLIRRLQPPPRISADDPSVPPHVGIFAAGGPASLQGKFISKPVREYSHPGKTVKVAGKKEYPSEIAAYRSGLISALNCYSDPGQPPPAYFG